MLLALLRAAIRSEGRIGARGPVLRCPSTESAGMRPALAAGPLRELEPAAEQRLGRRRTEADDGSGLDEFDSASQWRTFQEAK